MWLILLNVCLQDSCAVQKQFFHFHFCLVSIQNMPQTEQFPVWGYTHAINILVRFFDEHMSMRGYTRKWDCWSQGRYGFSFSGQCQTILTLLSVVHTFNIVCLYIFFPFLAVCYWLSHQTPFVHLLLAGQFPNHDL